MSKTDYTPTGWAMEARLNAEDPLRNFLPSAGTLGAVAFPLKDSGAPHRCGNPTLTLSGRAGCELVAAAYARARAGGCAPYGRQGRGPTGSRARGGRPARPIAEAPPGAQRERPRARAPAGVRVDTWVETGTEVTPHYDSLLAKLMVHAASRPAATAALQAALGATTLGGIATNLDYVATIAAAEGFAAGAHGALRRAAARMQSPCSKLRLPWPRPGLHGGLTISQGVQRLGLQQRLVLLFLAVQRSAAPRCRAAAR